MTKKTSSGKDFKQVTPVQEKEKSVVCFSGQVYRAEAKLVEDFYRDLGVLVDFEITSGIPETLPVLLQFLEKYIPADFSEEGKKMAA